MMLPQVAVDVERAHAAGVRGARHAEIVDVNHHDALARVEPQAPQHRHLPLSQHPRRLRSCIGWKRRAPSSWPTRTSAHGSTTWWPARSASRAPTPASSSPTNGCCSGAGRPRRAPPCGRAERSRSWPSRGPRSGPSPAPSCRSWSSRGPEAGSRWTSPPVSRPIRSLHGERDTALNALVARFPELVGVGEGRPALRRRAPARPGHLGSAGVRARRGRLAAGARRVPRAAGRQALRRASPRGVHRLARGRARAREPRRARACGRARRAPALSRIRALATGRGDEPRSRSRCRPVCATRSARPSRTSASPFWVTRCTGRRRSLSRIWLHAESLRGRTSPHGRRCRRSSSRADRYEGETEAGRARRTTGRNPLALREAPRTDPNRLRLPPRPTETLQPRAWSNSGADAGPGISREQCSARSPATRGSGRDDHFAVGARPPSASSAWGTSSSP